MGKILSELDSSASILTIRVVGEVKDAQAIREIPLIWEEHPETRTYDSIIDLLLDEGSISWEAIVEIAAKWNSFARDADLGRRSAIVVRNDLWDAIVKAIATRFPARRFAIFNTAEEARRWIESRSNAA